MKCLRSADMSIEHFTRADVDVVFLSVSLFFALWLFVEKYEFLRKKPWKGWQKYMMA